jgi:uncharacterized membrane protein HdeD (DUF308 family)
VLAFFGLGTQELIILAVLALLVIVPAVIVLAIVVANRKPSGRPDDRRD